MRIATIIAVLGFASFAQAGVLVCRFQTFTPSQLDIYKTETIKEPSASELYAQTDVIISTIVNTRQIIATASLNVGLNYLDVEVLDVQSGFRAKSYGEFNTSIIGLKQEARLLDGNGFAYIYTCESK